MYRNGHVVLPFCKVVLHAQKPRQMGYPTEPKTLGQHLKKRRMDMRMSQKKVATLLGISREVYGQWEADHISPRVSSMPKVIDLLGYAPLDDGAVLAIGDRVRQSRRVLGLTRDEAAERLGVTGTTISYWETGRVVPAKRHRKAIEAFVASVSRVGEIGEAPAQQPDVLTSSRFLAAAGS